MHQVSPAEKRQLDAEWRDYTTQIRSLQAAIDELQHEKEGTRRNLNIVTGMLSGDDHPAPDLRREAGVSDCCCRCQMRPLKSHSRRLSDAWSSCCVSVHCADRLQQRQSVKGRRLGLLEQRNRGITDVFKWVQANGDRFKGPVFGPLICEVGVDNPLHANMLEQSVRGAAFARIATVMTTFLQMRLNSPGCTGCAVLRSPACRAGVEAHCQPQLLLLLSRSQQPGDC